ncbi:MAG: polysaccharide deacetylase family protein [Leptolyngbyaceae bacterium]|nr:polysaccharide deacetylase family protein [Leptolyngbyaceae bacterium]
MATCRRIIQHLPLEDILMDIQKQQFVDAGKWMKLPVDRLPDYLKVADVNLDNHVNSPDEFGRLYDEVIAGGDGQAGLVAIASLMQQSTVSKPEALGARSLQDVVELQPIWQGLGRIIPMRGVTAGTMALQSALNEISEKLPDYPKCHVGAVDGWFGALTEQAVKEFQAVHQELESTGKVDQLTLKLLDAVLERSRSIQVNAVQPIEPEKLKVISYGDRFGTNCALTFDDGPDPDTEAVLDALKAHNIQGATFFVQGINARRYPRILQRIVDEGHVIGNHTYDHPDLRKLSVQDIEQQLRMCQDAVNNVLGTEYVMTQMRPPYGAFNDAVKGVLRAQKLALIMWQIDSNDWRLENRRNTQNIVANVFSGYAPVTGGRGGALLFHDIHGSTGQILPDILQRLTTEGLKITTVEALLQQKYSA